MYVPMEHSSCPSPHISRYVHRVNIRWWRGNIFFRTCGPCPEKKNPCSRTRNSANPVVQRSVTATSHTRTRNSTVHLDRFSWSIYTWMYTATQISLFQRTTSTRTFWLIRNPTMSANGQTIQNAAIGTYADLEGPTHVPGSNLIVYKLNQVNGTRNQNVCC